MSRDNRSRSSEGARGGRLVVEPKRHPAALQWPPRDRLARYRPAHFKPEPYSGVSALLLSARPMHHAHHEGLTTRKQANHEEAYEANEKTYTIETK